MRQELGTDHTAERKKKRQSKKSGRNRKCDRPVPHGPTNNLPVANRQMHQSRVLPLLAFLAEQKSGQGGSNHHGKKQSAEKGKHHGPSHRLEQLPFHALQREDRQVGGDNDRDRVENGPLNFARCDSHLLEHGAVVFFVFRQVPDDVFHHDHGAVYHHSEVERTERKQVRGDMPQVQANRSEQQRKRNRQRDDESTAHVAKEDKKNDHDKDHAFAEVVQNGVRCVVNQVVTVKIGHHLHAWGQNLSVQPVYHGVNAFKRSRCVCTLSHEHNALDHVVVVIYDAIGTVNGPPNLPQADLRALFYGRNVAHANRRAILRLDDGLLYVFHRSHQPDCAHIDLLRALLDKTATAVGIAVAKLLLDL